MAIYKSVGAGAEMFQNETGSYPKSRGTNPFLESDDQFVTGAQWLVMQLSGPDLAGYVKPVRENDVTGDGRVDENDWQFWYSTNPDTTAAMAITRLGPYVDASGELAQPPQLYAQRQSFVGPIPDDLSDVRDDDGNRAIYGVGELPFYVDSFGYPILYYRANPFADQIVTTCDDSPCTEGVYAQGDNALITGGTMTFGDFVGDEYDGWDLGYGPAPEEDLDTYHPLGRLGFDPDDPGETPPTKSFTFAIFDRELYDATYEERTQRGRLEPRNKNSFLLISPGPDGRYGTLDDVTNY
jgi:hypothetical protein